MQDPRSQQSDAEKARFELTFSSLEASLARSHDIASDKRIAFQGRLKTLLRLGFPAEIKKGKGRAAAYSAGDAIRMAVYVELAEFGLTPERAVELIEADIFPLFAAVKRSVDLLRTEAWDAFQRGDVDAAEPIFIYFDPMMLSPLKGADAIGKSFRWAGANTVARHIAKVTSTADHRRLSIVNVTALIDAMTAMMKEDQRTKFLVDAERWARFGTEIEPDRDIVPAWEKR